MTDLKRTNVTHRTGDIETIAFTTDKGEVELVQFDDGYVELEVGHEDASVDEVADILNDVADHDAMDASTVEAAFSILADATTEESEDDTDEDEDVEVADVDDTAQEGDVVYVTEDGTRVRVGDKINHPSGGDYEITGRETEHSLAKSDPMRMEYEIVNSTVEKDVQELGFAERVDA